VKQSACNEVIVTPLDAQPHEKMRFQLNLRRRGISDKAVLRAMEEVPRENFLDPVHRIDAYVDTALPIACGQTISQPYVVAYMTEHLRVQRQHRVLEVGTGSGYQAAVLSRLVRDVVTLERFKSLAERAAVRLSRLGYDNVEVIVGDGFEPADELGHFDRIMVTAAMLEIPDTLQSRLNDGGIMVAPVGAPDDIQTLVAVQRQGDDFERNELIGVRFVPALRGVSRAR
jgi:protein-L-isoaspartate(D-aspartate) O-methyltransferase